MAKEWYSLRVVSGQENKISKTISKMVENEELPPCIGDVYIPMHDVPSVRAGKQYMQKRRVIPGYVLIEIDMSLGWKDIATEVRNVDGIIGFAGVTSSGDKPRCLTEEEARHMLNYGKDGASITSHSVDHFVKNEMIHIKSGPFKSFRGKIEQVDAKRAVLKVSVEIFGRVTPIEIEYSEVEKV